MRCLFHGLPKQNLWQQRRATLMDIQSKSPPIDLPSLESSRMQFFCMTWFSFFLCFSAWFRGAEPRGKILPAGVRNVQ